jgi:hypothetical protein
MPDVPQMDFRRDFGKYTPDKKEKFNARYWRPDRPAKKHTTVTKAQAIKIQDEIIARKLRWIKDDQ